MADLRHLGKRRRAGAGRRAARAVRPRRCRQGPSMTYSGGMRRRLDLAMTLVGDPRIIFLDEPTAGLDPRSRRVMWDIVRDLVADGVTIFLTTQYLEEADRLAEPDRAARRRPDRRPGHAGRAQAPRPGRQRPARVRRRRRSSTGRPGRSATAPRDDEGLALQLPNDGGVAVAAGAPRPARRGLDRRRRARRSRPPTSTTSSCPSPAATTTRQAPTRKGARP